MLRVFYQVHCYKAGTDIRMTPMDGDDAGSGSGSGFGGSSSSYGSGASGGSVGSIGGGYSFDTSLSSGKTQPHCFSITRGGIGVLKTDAGGGCNILTSPALTSGKHTYKFKVIKRTGNFNVKCDGFFVCQ